MASETAPLSPLILYRQGLAFSKQKESYHCLKLAVKTFENVVEIKPEYFDAWERWGITLVELGIQDQDTNCVQEAIRIFFLRRRALAISTESLQKG